ncbi:acyl-CoA desaturase [Bradyrhizobium sp. CB82]|uniref:acyl-CoA desaturase n=1 Tax=Bradyrhizobium sp. CB82 TaxID=3039159 RepID=UPI0024B27FFF|nr:acyl-CoA desaturase [Bradyrhizobium sp. CB82]WFU37268.1 acyl-CoA desaturase [Bradyrhizobium sp. CB82]
MSVADAEFVPEGSQSTLAQLPPGVIVSGPVVQAKLRESYLLLGILYVGSIAGLIWAFTQGIGKVELAVFAGMFSLTTFGIGAGMHRLLVHRSFRCGPVMRTFFCAIAQMAIQGSIAKWVANHRRYHLYADHVGDPHSPLYDGFGNRYISLLKGFLHAQGGWVFDQATTDNDFYAKDILADPIAMFFVRTRWVWYGLSAVFLPAAIGYACGGIHTMIGCALFSGLFRAYLLILVSQLTGSVCHSYGYRRFELDDASTNELVTTILTFGEGLHNNHHRFPRDAYVSHAWYEFDLNGLIILGMEKLGLVHDVFRASHRQLELAETAPEA